MADWFGWRARIEALERELATKQQVMGDMEVQIAHTAGLLKANAEVIAVLDGRLNTLAQHLEKSTAQARASDAALPRRLEEMMRDVNYPPPTPADLLERLHQLETRQEPGADALAAVQLSLVRLDKQMQMQAEDLEKLANAIFERIARFAPR